MNKTSKKEYYAAIGRRKTSVAKVKITKATKNSYDINGKDLVTYFPTDELRKIVTGAFEVVEISQRFTVVVTVRGGGIHSQAEAVRHGIARALTIYDPELRSTLKKVKMLKRDPRRKERKKFGLKKARKSPQWSKR
ncbi:MAG: 30S ribosomal protein S9 [Patescibacteria group bacterium]|nr:30S ribosomal protein S9 [Patescibacteria group bacterium]